MTLQLPVNINMAVQLCTSTSRPTLLIPRQLDTQYGSWGQSWLQKSSGSMKGLECVQSHGAVYRAIKLQLRRCWPQLSPPTVLAAMLALLPKQLQVPLQLEELSRLCLLQPAPRLLPHGAAGPLSVFLRVGSNLQLAYSSSTWFLIELSFDRIGLHE